MSELLRAADDILGREALRYSRFRRPRSCQATRNALFEYYHGGHWLTKNNGVAMLIEGLQWFQTTRSWSKRIGGCGNGSDGRNRHRRNNKRSKSKTTMSMNRYIEREQNDSTSLERNNEKNMYHALRSQRKFLKRNLVK
jgi:hypothetical protein